MKYIENFIFFYRTLRYRIFLRMFFNMAVGLLDGFGLAMFLPLLQLVDGNSSNTSQEGLGSLDFIIDGMTGAGLPLNLANVLMVLAAFFLLKGIAQYCNGLYDVIIRLFFVKKTRTNLTEAMSQMSYKAFVLSDVGRIQNTMTGEVGNIIQAYQQYFGAFQQGILVCVYMLFAFFVDAKFALLICLGGVMTNLVYNRIYSITKRTSYILTSGSNLYQGLIIQFTAHFKYLKATGSLSKYNEKLINSIALIDTNFKKIGKLGVIVSASREPLLIIVVCAVILIQVNGMGGSLGAILISLLFFYRALNSLMQMQTAYNGFLAVSGSLANMTSFEKELSIAKEYDGKIDIISIKKGITLEDASFSYKNERMVIKNINLTVNRKETIAVVGESGSGKTTLINVLVGLLPLSKGTMMIDGINRNDLKISSYQKRIGYITQDPVVFNDTVFNNITFWDEATSENLTRFERAMKNSSIEEFINSLPEKGQTILGNNGVNLSGGQKQRISIARELYKDVDILVLDEATSSLDSETERAIQNNIDALKGKYTVLIVAHRLSTVKNASRIILMDKGEIIDEGNFESLIKSSERFKKAVKLQEMNPFQPSII